MSSSCDQIKNLCTFPAPHSLVVRGLVRNMFLVRLTCILSCISGLTIPINVVVFCISTYLLINLHLNLVNQGTEKGAQKKGFGNSSTDVG